MPVVNSPVVFLDPAQDSSEWVDVRVEGRTVAAVVEELLVRYPALATRYYFASGERSTTWFGLYRDEDEYDLRHTPEKPLGADDRLHLVNLIGC